MTHESTRTRRIWLAIFGGLLIVFSVFQFLGWYLGSDRGQSGVLIGVIIVGLTAFINRLIFTHAASDYDRFVGLGLPAARGMLVATVVSALLVLVLPAYAIITNSQLAVAYEWLWVIPGLFAQAGIAEETLFRGFLFGSFRRRYPFWRAAILSAIPFAAVHLILFFTLDLVIAAAAFILAIVMSFPLAYLYELGGRTIWAPAVLHFTAQGAIKLVVIPETDALILPIVWMAAAAVIPFLAFLVPVTNPRTVDTVDLNSPR